MKLWLFMLILLTIISFYISLAAGSHWIEPFIASGLDARIVWDLRLPRVGAAFAIGGLLALAGAWFQVLLNNPLAEPYILGIASSGSLGAVLGLVLLETSWSMTVGAFIGAWLGIACVMAFAHLGSTRLLLAGVVLAAFWSALLALVLAMMPGSQLVVAFAWMMGDLSNPDLPTWLLILACLLALACGLLLASALDALLLGEQHAQALGVDIIRLRQQVLWLASACTALAVAAAGAIGFIGLVAPHAVRLLCGGLHRVVLPFALLIGGILLMLADTLARTIIAPAELPVGVLTALLGVPVFLWLLARTPQRG
ncbi:MAG: iron ABC transporter permease [Mariprofundales bacterium]